MKQCLECLTLCAPGNEDEYCPHCESPALAPVSDELPFGDDLDHYLERLIEDELPNWEVAEPEYLETIRA